jgi:hypothetical protein
MTRVLKLQMLHSKAVTMEFDNALMSTTSAVCPTGAAGNQFEME